tara:strand:- start:12733 stop:14112 length:1380 start_codon:yes stop_codon:yes gene_type:complete
MNQKLFLTTPISSIRECMELMDQNKHGIVFITDDLEACKVIGVLTDGDVRDALLKNASIDDSIKKYYNKNFVWFNQKTPREEMLRSLDNNIKVAPILKKDKTLFDIATRDYLPVQAEERIYARSKAPARITFGGGGSDLTHFFVKDNGAVINATISIYSHAFLKKRQDSVIIIKSLDLDEEWKMSSLKEALSNSDIRFNLFKSLLNAIKPSYGFELYIHSDFPKGSGLGGSSVVSAAVIGCFNEFRADKWDLHDMAEIAFQAERLHMNISGGWQDQYATVFGGINFIEFTKDRNHIHSLKLSDKIICELEENLLLFKLPKSREVEGDSIHQNQKESMKSKDVNSSVKKAVKLCYTMKDQLVRGKLTEFGYSLNEAWQLKRKFSSKISNKEIDSFYAHAIKNGALGGKLLGAGGGGYFLFYIKPLNKHYFIKEMKKINLEITDFLFIKNGMKSWTMREKN